MPLFVPTVDRAYDTAWREFQRRGAERFELPPSNAPGEDAALQALLEQRPHQPWLQIHVAPEQAITSFSLQPEAAKRAEGVTNRFALEVMRALLQDLALPNSYVGRSRGPSVNPSAVPAGLAPSEAAQQMICAAYWVHLTPALRFYFEARITRVGKVVSCAHAYVFLWRQPWMTRHPDTPSWWIELARHFQLHFSDDIGLYADAYRSFNRGLRYFGKGLLGRLRFYQRGQPNDGIYVSSAFKTFYSFAVSDVCFGAGSHGGGALNKARDTVGDVAVKFRNRYGDR